MTLARWSPVSQLATFEIDSLNRMFDAAFGAAAPADSWIPSVDIYETAGQEVIVKVELPEMKREDIKVTFENNVLTVEGERKTDAAVDRERFHRLERNAGTFRRSFTLPATLDAARVQAGYQDGVLTITLPRREDSRPRQIPVNG